MNLAIAFIYNLTFSDLSGFAKVLNQLATLKFL